MKLFFALLFLVTTHAWAACELSFPTQAICGHVTWTQGPFAGTYSDMEIVFEPEITGLTLKVDAWMPAMGHGTRPVVMITRDDGVVEISNIYLMMPGLWQIRATLTDENGQSERAEMPVQL